MFRLITLNIVVVLFINCFSQESELVKNEIKLAEKQIKEENFEEAMKHVDNVLDNDALNIEALELKTNIMIQTGRDKGFLKEINELIQQFPQQAEYYYLRAIIHLYRQKSNRAIDDLNDAEYYSMPEDHMYKVFQNKGTAYYYYNDFVNAEKNFKKSIELKPRNAAVYHSWGMLKYDEQLYDEAINHFNKSLQFQANNPIAHYNLGMAYYKIDDLKNACYNFNRSCTLGNQNGCKVYYLECTE